MNKAQRKRRRAIYFAARTLETYCINAWLLPDDFDDDTRIAEAVIRYHPPRAWTACYSHWVDDPSIRRKALMLRPFFSFYGGKWRAAPHYPAPRFGRVIEPFAGAAGYSTRHHERDVVLVEADPVIAGLWRWLISAPASEVLALPAEVPDTVAALGLAPGPAALIGFYCNCASTGPHQRPSAWMRQGVNKTSFWGDAVRARIASQVGAIRHWTVIEGDFTSAPDEVATYFVDPPYVGAGVHYRKRFARHAELGDWCRARRGQVIACENVGATWLPFEHFRDIQSNPSKRGKGTSAEAIWLGP